MEKGIRINRNTWTTVVWTALAGCASLETLFRIQSYRITLANSTPADTTVTNISANRHRRPRPL